MKKYFGCMISVAHSSNLTIDSLKRYALYLKKFGYNMIQLYTEDAFEVDNEPYFGYLRGGYTKDELKEFVSYCDSIDMEVIPCIESLAHLGYIFKWKEYKAINDVDDVLLVDNERTYTLLENIFKTLRECFTSKRVNVGLDEAINLGLGQYLKEHGYTSKVKIFFNHLKRINEIANKYDFRVMMWSDMLFTATDGNYYKVNKDRLNEIDNLVPDNVDLVYWEYFFYHEKQYEEMFDIHRMFNRELWYAGAVHDYIGFTTINEMSEDALRAGMRACRNKKIDNVLITLWGGNDCSHFQSLPALLYAKCIYDGIENIDIIKQKFYDIVGIEYDVFASLDSANTLPMHYLKLPEISFSKYVVFQDVFNGFFDPVLKLGSTRKYLKKAKEFEILSQQYKEFGYLFNKQSKLLKLMYYKHDLGLLLRKAYQEHNLDKLKKLLTRLNKTIKSANEFYYAFRNEFMIERKPQSFDIFDIQLGGLIRRLTTCKEMLISYLSGELEKIDELEKPLLPFNGIGISYLFWERMISANFY